MEKTYKTVIIDDEKSAASELSNALSRYACVSIEGVASTGKDGIDLVLKTRPDLIFLDVELPDMLGMEVLAAVREVVDWNLNVVFYTAHDKYMLDALRSKAFDFLIKPIVDDELEGIINRFLGRMKSGEQSTAVALPDMGGEKPLVVVTPVGDLRFLKVSDIGYFRYDLTRKNWEAAVADGTFIPLRHTVNSDYLCTFNPAFVQVGRSCIINTRYLVMVQGVKCIMYPPFNVGEELQISKKYKKMLLDKFCQL